MLTQFASKSNFSNKNCSDVAKQLLLIREMYVRVTVIVWPWKQIKMNALSTFYTLYALNGVIFLVK